MTRTPAKFLGADGTVIERMTDAGIPYVFLVESRRVGPWTDDAENPCCPITLVPKVYAMMRDGIYLEIAAFTETKGILGDIFPNRAMCIESGRNPESSQLELEDDAANLEE